MKFIVALSYHSGLLSLINVVGSDDDSALAPLRYLDQMVPNAGNKDTFKRRTFGCRHSAASSPWPLTSAGARGRRRRWARRGSGAPGRAAGRQPGTRAAAALRSGS